MKKKDIINELTKIFWIFMIGSLLGYIFETVIVLFQTGHFEVRQGVIYGPLIPVYGIGGVVYYMVFQKLKTKDVGKVFLFSMILGGITEYVCSFLQEKIFHTISWDYSYLPYNLNGRTSLLHCTYWGLAGILYIKCIEPCILKIGEISKKKSVKIVTIIVAIFMVYNITISSMAAIRQKDRLHSIPPRNSIEKFLDKYYPDEYMNSIFVNKIDK